MTNPSIAVLCDQFSPGLNSALWTVPYLTDLNTTGSLASVGSTTVPTTVNLTPACGVSASVVQSAVECGNDNGVGSVIPYDLTSSGLSAEISGWHRDSNYFATFSLADNGSDWLSWFVYYNGSQDTLTAGTSTGLRDYIPYNPQVHRYLRIRENGGATYWDYSTDGISWTNATSLVNPFSVTGLYVNLFGEYQSGSGSGAVSWSNVNYVL